MPGGPFCCQTSPGIEPPSSLRLPCAQRPRPKAVSLSRRAGGWLHSGQQEGGRTKAGRPTFLEDSSRSYPCLFHSHPNVLVLSHMAAPTCKGDWEIESSSLVAVCSATRYVSSVTKRERAVVPGGELAGCLGKSSDAWKTLLMHQRIYICLLICPLTSLGLSFLSCEGGMMGTTSQFVKVK